MNQKCARKDALYTPNKAFLYFDHTFFITCKNHNYANYDQKTEPPPQKYSTLHYFCPNVKFWKKNLFIPTC